MAARRKVTPKKPAKTSKKVTPKKSTAATADEFEDEFEDEEDPEDDFDDELDDDEEESEQPAAGSGQQAEEQDPEPAPEPRVPKVIPGGRGTEEDRDRTRRYRALPSADAQRGELFDISTWLSTGEAAKLVGRHPQTIKNWRLKNKVRAQLDDSGCWRHNPDDLVEAMESPEADDANPAGVLAVGMESIVRQGDKAGDRVLAMTEIATGSLERTIELLQAQLENLHARNATLEERLAEAYDRGMTNLESSYKHERWKLKMQHEHEKEMAGEAARGTRLAGLLQVLGPIGASIAMRMGGDEATAQKVEAATVSRLDTSALPFEARLADAMARLDVTLRELDPATAAGFRLMLPEDVRAAVDAIRDPSTAAELRGKALGTVIRSAVALPPAQFEALRPVGPAAVVAVLSELRALNEEKE